MAPINVFGFPSDLAFFGSDLFVADAGANLPSVFRITGAGAGGGNPPTFFAGPYDNLANIAFDQADRALREGRAKAVFLKHMEAQRAKEGAVWIILEAYRRCLRVEVVAPADGYISRVATKRLAEILQTFNKPPRNDALGLRCLKRKGDYVQEGEPLVELRMSNGLKKQASTR